MSTLCARFMVPPREPDDVAEERSRRRVFFGYVARHAIGAAWLMPELRVQLADAWRWVLGPEHAPNFDRWLERRGEA